MSRFLYFIGYMSTIAGVILGGKKYVDSVTTKKSNMSPLTTDDTNISKYKNVNSYHNPMTKD